MNPASFYHLLICICVLFYSARAADLEEPSPAAGTPIQALSKAIQKKNGIEFNIKGEWRLRRLDPATHKWEEQFQKADFDTTWADNGANKRFFRLKMTPFVTIWVNGAASHMAVNKDIVYNGEYWTYLRLASGAIDGKMNKDNEATISEAIPSTWGGVSYQSGLEFMLAETKLLQKISLEEALQKNAGMFHFDTETIDGNELVKMSFGDLKSEQSPRDVSWLDPARNYCLVKREIELSRSAEFNEKIVYQVDEFKEMAPGFVIPSKGVKRHYRNGNMIDEYIIKITDATTKNKVELNDFVATFDEGCKILDTRTGVTVVVGKSAANVLEDLKK